MGYSSDIPIIGAESGLSALDLLGLGTTSVACHHNSSQARAPRFTRQRARYPVDVPVVCHLILPSREVDSTVSIAGTIEDVSANGIGLSVPDAVNSRSRIYPGDSLLVSAVVGTVARFVDVQVVQVSKSGGSTRIHATLDGPLKNLTEGELVIPKLDAEKFHYGLPVEESVLRSLVSVGVAQRIVLDRVFSCPQCHSIPTVRNGCGMCLSHDVERQRMIHHFACAHVDFVERFDRGNEIVCPKCLGRRMIVGADFEYLDGPVECRECAHADNNFALVGHCLACSHRFPFRQARQLELAGYRVYRLDLLALLDQNR